MKDKAALSMSKGLQTRRLPSHIAEVVPKDYAEQRRRHNTYSQSGSTASPRRMRAAVSTPTVKEEEEEEPSEEEKQKKVRTVHTPEHEITGGHSLAISLRWPTKIIITVKYTK